MSIRFDGKVVIITGAGNGLGRAHALGFAARGAHVVVNDLGGGVSGTGASSEAAQRVVAEIEAQGGIAIADGANVTDFGQVQAMAQRALSAFGRIDVLVNNAGILRDKSFANMDLADFKAVVDVHLMGSVNCTKAVWGTMRTQGSGRVIFTTSSTGLYGNFGQSNYGAAKAALAGLMKTLHEEGRKYGVRVNAVCPVAATRMTETLLPPGTAELLQPDDVTPAVLYLASEEAPSGVILTAGAGSYARAMMVETDGIYLEPQDRTPETVAARFAEISDPAGQRALAIGLEQTMKFLNRAMTASQQSAKAKL